MFRGSRDVEAEAVIRFHIRGWDSYKPNNYILVEAVKGAVKAALKSTAQK